MRLKQGKLAMVSAFAALVGCGVPAVQESSLRHDPTKTLWSEGPLLWGEIPEKYYSTFWGADEDEILPKDHELVKRANYWVRKIDDAIREAHPEVRQAVPKPQVAVIDSSTVNAFVRGIFYCSKVRVSFDGATNERESSRSGGLFGGLFGMFGGGEQGSGVDYVLISQNQPKFTALSEMERRMRGMNCFADELDEATVEAFAARLSEVTPDCKVTARQGEEGPELRVGRGCQVDKRLLAAGSVTEIVTTRVGNWLTLYSGIFNALSEGELVSVIGHELGHFYKSHTNVPAKDYDYFYRIGDRNAEGKPEPAPELAELGKAAVVGTSVATQRALFARFPDQRLRTELFFGAGTLAAQLCTSERGCPDSCEPLIDLIQDPSFFKALGENFPLAIAKDTAYQKFEDFTQACLEQVDLNKSGNTGTLSHGEYDHLVFESPALPAKMQNRMWAMLFAGIVETGVSRGDEATAWDALMGASRRIGAEHDAAVKVLDHARDERLGYYTTEQEADEFAVDWISRLGIHPKHAVHSYISLSHVAGRPAFLPNELSGDDCDALYKNGWLDKEKKAVFVSVADFLDDHHTPCFRAWNVDREVAAHGLQTGDDQWKVEGPSWDELQAMSRELAAAEKAREKEDDEGAHDDEDGDFWTRRVSEHRHAPVQTFADDPVIADMVFNSDCLFQKL